MTGKAIVEIAKKHIGEKFVLGSRAKYTDVNYKGPWDCAEFGTWCVYQVSGHIYGAFGKNPLTADAYTGEWMRQALQDGATINIAEAAKIPGAILVRHSGRNGHVAISNGNNGTIEAMGSRWGVREGKIFGRKWNFGVLVPGVTYNLEDIEIEIEEDPVVYQITHPYMSGSKIEQIQQALKDIGYDPGTVDGIYGLRTELAVKKYQIDQGLVPDGDVGPQTLESLGIS